MDISKLRDAISQISASDEYKTKTKKLLSEHDTRSSEPARPEAVRSRKYRRPLAFAVAIAVVVITGAFLLSHFSNLNIFRTSTMTATGVTADPADGTKAGCSDDFFARRNYSLLEVDGSLYYVRGDKKLFLYQPSGSDQQLMALASNSILTDGTYFYYSLDAKIYQFSIEDPTPKVILEKDHGIHLDYIDQNRMIFHNYPGNHYDYAVLDRASGQTRLLFKDLADYSRDSTGVYQNLFDVFGDTAVFQISGGNWSSLYAVNLMTCESTKVYEGLVISARIIDATVYFALDANMYDSHVDKAPDLWSVPVDGGSVSRVDLSGISFNNISWIVKSGDDLLLATYDPARISACVYLYIPATGQVILQEEGFGLIYNFFATDHYYSLYDLLGGTNEEGISIIGEIVR